MALSQLNPSPSWSDRFGRTLSACCAVHCLLMPIALVVFPLKLALWVRHEPLHLTVVTGSLFLAGWAYYRGVRQHGRQGLFVFMAIAAAAVLTGELFLESQPWWHAGISALAGFALAWGHQKNLAYCRDAQCACPSHESQAEEVLS